MMWMEVPILHLPQPLLVALGSSLQVWNWRVDWSPRSFEGDAVGVVCCGSHLLGSGTKQFLQSVMEKELGELGENWKQQRVYSEDSK